ncbi:unnamed protein product [Didymodactylos carnosus]|uniref:Uncharacterized protein n=1 Tax=Didymodactylos carnosus TaxID=1234261 RepID=A0A814D555_9BILA|nr:unnamed protein product [Didymodactylos carnosus]CAF1167820.1 unnamed protein product [Didymodactylos carnosus]CAF3725301.1 unnamed protein product [Didymodactylos carnosus]CAF3979351.1 unnamed protein product [Didymodactylos carnosus]
MKILILIQLIGGICYAFGSGDISNDEKQKQATEAYNRVRDYLKIEEKKYNSSSKLTRTSTNVGDIPNSNIIGSGYNPVKHSPLCFTRDCKMATFGLPIFSFNYVKPEPGTGCAKGLLKPHPTVTFRCTPGAEKDSHVDIIDKLESLKKTTMIGLEINGGAKIPISTVNSVAASYKSSIQTKFMVDNILQKHYEIISTTRKVTFADLRMFQEQMSLSDSFIYTIENLPCCEYTDTVYRYIADHLFDQFGFTYVEHMILGGIASENIFIHQSNVTKLKENSVNIAREASISFGEVFHVGTNATFSHNVEEKNKFDRSIEDRYSKVIEKVDEVEKVFFSDLVDYTDAQDSVRCNFLFPGVRLESGNQGLKGWEEWSKSVEDNPVVIKFAVNDIFRLLTPHRFQKPNSHIVEKKELIRKALDTYLNISFYCPGNCVGHGKCVDTGYFQVGECKCNTGWTGADCSVMVGLSGTLCGINDKIECNGGPIIEGNTPQYGCAPGYVREKYHWSVTCRKASSTIDVGFAGTLCGINVKGFVIECGGKKPWLEKCPNGYKLTDIDGGGAYYCYKTDASSEDLPGTLCGFGRTYSNRLEDIDCDGHYPSRGDCPRNYHLRSQHVGQTTFTYTYAYCVKD